MILNKADLLSTLRSLPDIIGTYVSNIPEELLDRKRNEEAWTIREHIYHIAFVQEMLYSRLLKIKEEERPVITPYFPEEKEGAPYDSVQHAVSHYKAVRERQLALINQLAEADFQREAKHGEYISYNIPIIINHMIFHEYWHMYRLEEIWLTKDEYFA